MPRAALTIWPRGSQPHYDERGIFPCADVLHCFRASPKVRARWAGQEQGSPRRNALRLGGTHCDRISRYRPYGSRGPAGSPAALDMDIFRRAFLASVGRCRPLTQLAVGGAKLGFATRPPGALPAARAVRPLVPSRLVLSNPESRAGGPRPRILRPTSRHPPQTARGRWIWAASCPHPRREPLTADPPHLSIARSIFAGRYPSVLEPH